MKLEGERPRGAYLVACTFLILGAAPLAAGQKPGKPVPAWLVRQMRKNERALQNVSALVQDEVKQTYADRVVAKMSEEAREFGGKGIHHVRTHRWTAVGPKFLMREEVMRHKPAIGDHLEIMTTAWDGSKWYDYNEFPKFPEVHNRGSYFDTPNTRGTPLSFGYHYLFTPLSEAVGKLKMTLQGTREDPELGTVYVLVGKDRSFYNDKRQVVERTVTVELTSKRDYLASAIRVSSAPRPGVKRESTYLPKKWQRLTGVWLAVECEETDIARDKDGVLSTYLNRLKLSEVSVNDPRNKVEFKLPLGAEFEDQRGQLYRVGPGGKMIPFDG